MDQGIINPTQVARRTLRLLATRKITPTPDNYERIYHELAGTTFNSTEFAPEQMLHAFVGELIHTFPQLRPTAMALQKASRENDWNEFKTKLLECIAHTNAGTQTQPSWASVIRKLLYSLETSQAGLSQAKKRAGLEKVLDHFSSDSANLYPKLENLLKTWSEIPFYDSAIELKHLDPSATPAATQPLTPSTSRTIDAPVSTQGQIDHETLDELRELLADALELALAPQFSHAPEIADETLKFAKRIRATRDRETLAQLGPDLKQFWAKLEILGGDYSELNDGLLRVLQLLVENVGELVDEDQWLKGQISVVRNSISGRLNVRAMDDAENRLKEAIYKQGILKHSLKDAKSAMKDMIANFIERLGQLSESTGEYQDTIEDYSQQIAQATDISQISHILDAALRETQTVKLNTQRSRDELINARKKVESAEQKIKTLESTLGQISEMVKEDELTGALNRRGLDEAFGREVARSERRKTPLCVALLDVDNFKSINDNHGHQAGDDALVHLTRVVKETVRPTDVVARFGGEEFVVLLPDSDLDEAIKVMTRLQRELTKKFFLHGNKRILITFSAGVALREPDEKQESIIARADTVLYKAKQSGKNQVVADHKGAKAA